MTRWTFWNAGYWVTTGGIQLQPEIVDFSVDMIVGVVVEVDNEVVRDVVGVSFTVVALVGLDEHWLFALLCRAFIKLKLLEPKQLS